LKRVLEDEQAGGPYGGSRLSCLLINGGKMADVTVPLKMQGIPPMLCCMNEDCDVFLFADKPTKTCPGCWEPSQFMVEKFSFELRK
jgi:hypothetical protein